jgi:hypothetical protein
VYTGRLAARHDEQQRLARRHGLLSAWRRLLLGALVVLVVLVEREGLLAKLVLAGAPRAAAGEPDQAPRAGRPSDAGKPVGGGPLRTAAGLRRGALGGGG